MTGAQGAPSRPQLAALARHAPTVADPRRPAHDRANAVVALRRARVSWPTIARATGLTAGYLRELLSPAQRETFAHARVAPPSPARKAREELRAERERRRELAQAARAKGQP